MRVRSGRRDDGKFQRTFCSRSCASRTSAVCPTACIFSSRVSIRASHTSTSFLFASYRWLSPSIASNCVFLCITFEFVSSQCSLSFVTATTIGQTRAVERTPGLLKMINLFLSRRNSGNCPRRTRRFVLPCEATFSDRFN